MGVHRTAAGLCLLSFCSYAFAGVYIVSIAGPALLAKVDEAPEFAHPEVSGAYKRSLHRMHDAILQQAVGSSASKLYSYSHVYNGFAATLQEEEALALKEHPAVADVYEDVEYFTQTTYTRRFLGLDKAAPIGAWTKSTGAGVVIGIFDTGLWPEDPNFSDEGMADPPSTFAGTCEAGEQWNATTACNRKVVGARIFASAAEAKFNISYADPIWSDVRSPRDVDGHGSHMASIAAGAPVQNVEINGAPFGKSTGVAFRAHLAIYKVCWSNPVANPADPSTYRTCLSADILAALEAAIQDGVHVASLSLSPKPSAPVPRPLAKGLDVGALFAALAGVTVVVPAGNSGPDARSIMNNAPWYTSVAASSDARPAVPPAAVAAGSGTSYVGTSYTGGSAPTGQQLPAVYAANATLAGQNASDARYCLAGTLDPAVVQGKIVLCERGINGLEEKGYVLKNLGAAGMVIKNRKVDPDDNITPIFHFLPAVHLRRDPGLALKNYLIGSPNPTACIFPMAVTTTVEAPVVLNFTSRGPNPLISQILKPDVTAPGRNIIGAWSGVPALTSFGTADGGVDTRTTAFFIASGTSQATAHVAGVAALIKALHFTWSPSMIQSAIATSAYVRDNRGQRIANEGGGHATPFDMGSGHITPNLALAPGLVYSAGRADYTDFLCLATGDPSKVAAVLGIACPKRGGVRAENYNGPSFVFPGVRRHALASRTVVSVGGPGLYVVRVEQPPGVRLSVAPARLRFRAAGERQAFRVSVRVLSKGLAGRFEYGAISWVDGTHVVRSPVAVQVV